MELIVRQGERERHVVIESIEPIVVLTVDGRRYQVDSVAVGRAVKSLLVDARQAEVGLKRRDRGYEVSSFRGRELVEVLDPLTLLAEKTHAGDSESASERVTAYMPGRVVEVLVSEGQEVESGEGILVLEAMKMENEIAAAREGRVKRIFVTTGQPVEGGDALYELE